MVREWSPYFEAEITWKGGQAQETTVCLPGLTSAQRCWMEYYKGGDGSPRSCGGHRPPIAATLALRW